MKRVFLAMLATTCLTLLPAAVRSQEAAALEGTREARLKAHEERIRKIVEDRKAQQLAAREQEAAQEQDAATRLVRLLVARDLGIADANAFVQVMRADGYATAKVAPMGGDPRGRYLVFLENLPTADAERVFDVLRRDGYSLPGNKMEDLVQPQPAPPPPLTVAFNLPVTGPPRPAPLVAAEPAPEGLFQADDDLSSSPAERRVTIAVSNAEAGRALSRLAAAADPMEFWAVQRKGANCMNVGMDRAYFAAARGAGLEWLRLTWSKWPGAGRDFLIGNADGFEGIPPGDLTRLREVLDMAAAERVPVVLAPLSLPGLRWRQQNEGRFDDRLWRDAKYHEQAAAFWKELAQAVRGRPAVVGYNLINEPAPARALKVDLPDRAAREAFEARVAGTEADLNQLYAGIVTAIRSVDTTTPVILDAGDFAGVDHLDFLKPLADARTLYAVHYYEPWTYTNFRQNGGKVAYPGAEAVRAPLGQVAAWARRHSLPPTRIMLAEFGCDRRIAGAEKYLADVVQAANGHGWHWAFYAYRPDDWDGMDYEIGPGRLPWAYWQAIERGERPTPPRKDTPLWQTLAGEFGREP